MARTTNKAKYGKVFGVIVVVVIVFLIIIISKSPTTTNSSASDGKASAKIVSQISTIPSSVSDQVGKGGSTVNATSISGKPYLTSNGLPNILYMGAEYCPYCATERWAMVVSLSRFGTFSNLGTTHSSSSDVYPNTQTFSFHGSTYQSRYVGFTPIEMYTNIPNASGYTTLDTPTPTEQSLMNTYDAPPYVSSSEQGSIPFIYFAGKYLIVGATYSPQILQNQTYQSIANALSSPKSTIAQGIIGAANNLTATICKLTNNQPTSACTPTIVGLESSH